MTWTQTPGSLLLCLKSAEVSVVLYCNRITYKECFTAGVCRRRKKHAENCHGDQGASGVTEKGGAFERVIKETCAAFKSSSGNSPTPPLPFPSGFTPTPFGFFSVSALSHRLLSRLLILIPRLAFG